MRINIVKEDPDDDKFIEAAFAGKAEYIISKDRHLLNINQYSGVKILPPEDFLALFNG